MVKIASVLLLFLIAGCMDSPDVAAPPDVEQEVLPTLSELGRETLLEEKAMFRIPCDQRGHVLAIDADVDWLGPERGMLIGIEVLVEGGSQVHAMHAARFPSFGPEELPSFGFLAFGDQPVAWASRFVSSTAPAEPGQVLIPWRLVLTCSGPDATVALGLVPTGNWNLREHAARTIADRPARMIQSDFVVGGVSAGAYWDLRGDGEELYHLGGGDLAWTATQGGTNQGWAAQGTSDLGGLRHGWVEVGSASRLAVWDVSLEHASGSQSTVGFNALTGTAADLVPALAFSAFPGAAYAAERIQLEGPGPWAVDVQLNEPIALEPHQLQHYVLWGTVAAKDLNRLAWPPAYS